MRLFWMRSLQGLRGPAWRGWVLPAYLTTLPGWCVGLLLLWAVLELLRWLWWPRRWA